MTEIHRFPLPLSTRINRLFAQFHHSDEPEVSNQDVATVIGMRLGRKINAADIDAARNGLRHLPHDVCTELCTFMYADPEYLIGTDETLIHTEDERLRQRIANRH
ncbi:hypothetical protein [Williamsia sterculiae]|uniref:Uncharacterized protein n=1 Tax=Williamsia sterculiae TaxID=1344003 RepID=A0A1N7HEE1_9NOCA|nr:hypothetical protein [Williamsia sterculiae]SIS23111.1 hypothetical protein SAMN05445060_4055 [Williamsia sterculiae]